MKKHDEIYELLTAFALGELTKEQTQRVRQHLKECDLCSNEVRKLKAVLDCTQQMKNKSVDETVFISAKEKLIERIESSKGETSATTKTQRRSIMQSKFAKFAIAAVVIAAVFVGLSILGVSPDGSSVAWASLAERVEQITTVTYRMHMKMKGMPGMPKDKVMDMETEIRLSSDYGMRMDASVEDKHVSQTYMLYAENALITIIPEQKKFMRMELTEQLRDKMREEANDPKKMVSDFMELDYVELGREEINGVLAEGVEVTDPKIAGGMLGDVIAQLWVDIETGFPVLIKMDFGSDDGSTEFNMVMEDFQWDIQLDAAEFAHVIPADYTSMGEVKMPEMNAEAAVEGFKLLMEINGGNFPKSMNLMEVLKEFGEIRGKQFRQQRRARKKAIEEAKAAGIDPDTLPEVQQAKTKEAIQQQMMNEQMKIQGICMFYMHLVTEDKDPAYYGDRITPADTDAILMRWVNDDGGYSVIFGDLSVGDFTPEELAEMEAKLPELLTE